MNPSAFDEAVTLIAKVERHLAIAGHRDLPGPGDDRQPAACCAPAGVERRLSHFSAPTTR
jgi:hypothetical protein